MPDGFHHIPDHFKTEEMFKKAVELDPSFLKLVTDHLKTQGICDTAVTDDPRTLLFVPDWFVTREGVAMCYDNSEYCDDHDDEDNFFKWCKGYKKRKAQKASIKEELLPITWHP